MLLFFESGPGIILKDSQLNVIILRQCHGSYFERKAVKREYFLTKLQQLF